MTEHLRPWEPPFAGTEAAHLLGALDRMRTTFRWKADDLDAIGLGVTVGASTLTLGGLLKHLAAVEELTSAVRLAGEPMGEPWASAGPEAEAEDWELTSAAGNTPEELYTMWDDAVARARTRFDAVLATGGLDDPVALTGPQDEPVSVRRLLCDLLEEYGRHTGHADLLREAVDGRVGEDPPDGWSPHRGRTPWHGHSEW